MIRRTKIGTILLAAFFAAGVIVTSCSKEEVISQPQKKPATSNIIKFGINLFNNWLPDEIGDNAPQSATKSAATYTEPVPMDCLEGEGPGTEILMYMIEEDLPVETDTVQTKGDAPQYKYGLYAFQMPTSAVNENSPAFNISYASTFNGMVNLGLTEDGQTYNGGDKYWPGDAWWLKFYLYYPYLAADDTYLQLSAISTTAGGTTTYSEPKFTYTVPTTVAEQKDIMSGTSDLIKGSVTNEVQIELTHLLSQISVKKGTLDEGVINYIAFNNIYNKGERLVATLNDDNSGSWTILPADAPATGQYKQEINLPVNDNSSNIGEPMYLLPQTLSDEATIEINLTVSSTDPEKTAGESVVQRSHTYPLTKKLNKFTAEWKPNKKYTYVISTPEEVEVEVNDVVETDANGNPVKKDLVIKNTGLSTAYIRASIVGNWVMPDDDDITENDIIVADWKTSDNAETGQKADGNFVYSGGQGSALPASGAIGDWIVIDGYYYYTKPLPSGSVATELFESYTLTANPPVANAVFDMSIVVQAIYVDDVTLAWPVTKGTDGTLTAKTASN